jgi:hypothetical protein
MQDRGDERTPDGNDDPAKGMRLASISQPGASRDFLLVLVLFVAFRVMSLLAFRPGGQVLDFSDFYWYREFAQLTRQGYLPYVNLWTTYPPLFPFLMIGLWRLSSLLPPWEFPNLWFSLLLGGTFLLFEIGNLILIYAIASRLSNRRAALRSAWFYAVLFVPVYTLTGWFECFPLFFFLLSLYLLLRGRPLWSGLTSGIGFMIKLIPVVLLPVGARLPRAVTSAGSEHVGLGSRRRLRLRLLNLTFDLRHLVSYLGVFVLTVVAIGLPFYLLNPRLVWGPLVITGVREPWETVWALFEGQFGYGVIPLDMRDITWSAPGGGASGLIWLVITVGFAAVYLFAYTRRFSWKEPRNVVAFTGFTIILFMLYSKGYSPQWLVWVLAFISILLPNLRGAFYAVVTGLLNLIEANIFFTMVPDEHWLLALTVGLRTLIFVLVAAEFLAIVQPHWLSPAVRRVRRWVLAGLAVLLLVGSVPAGVRFFQAYFDVRYQLSPYRTTISTLRAGSKPGAALVLNSYDHRTYDWLYPYLRQGLAFYMLDDYAPPGESVDARTIACLEHIASDHEDWWFFDSDPSVALPSEEVAMRWLDDHGTVLDVRDTDEGRLYHLTVRR